ncbi:hypothetical protein [Pararhodospirillum photometricum]|uniref:Secreted protein n=1 Tax=Pararhodospirillum photometricum DSM 122 TaxID=1150469 RepID=H6SLB6_PARPM|nr:hypothetical protein [Pararhodospirillum photometricum]CCG08781.1 Putative uncharacterized protein [Pararhodospirillum photometricum DSM 122]
MSPRAPAWLALGLALLASPVVHAGEGAEALMERYRGLCSQEAYQQAARESKVAAQTRGDTCDALAREIQAEAGKIQPGAAGSPLARPDPTVWSEDKP